MGIDTITVRGPVLDHDLPISRITRVLDSGTGEVTEHFTSASAELNGGLHLHVRPMFGRVYGSCEFSVPTYLQGHNRNPASVEATLDAARSFYRESSGLLTWACEVDDLLLSRIDLVRDLYDVEHLGVMLDGLHTLAVPRESFNCRYADPLGGGPNSLVRGIPGRWRGTLYDKALQLTHLARAEKDPQRAVMLHEQAQRAAGQVRFEANVRRPYALNRGLARLADVTDAKTESIRRALFRRARFDAPVGGLAQVDLVYEAMLKTPEIAKDAHKVIGLLHGDHRGFASPLSHNTQDRLRRIARTFDLSAADFSRLSGVRCRFDYDVGTVVAA